MESSVLVTQTGIWPLDTWIFGVFFLTQGCDIWQNKTKNILLYRYFAFSLSSSHNLKRMVNPSGNHYVLMANSLLFHLSLSLSLLFFLAFFHVLVSAPFASTCVCLFFVHVCLKSLCTFVWWFIFRAHFPYPCFFESPPTIPSTFLPSPSDPERGGGHLISRDDLEYPREYRTLGNSGRRFSNVGLVHTSEHRHTVTAAQSLEALTNLHKADMERKRDAFMDHLKSKYQQQQQQQLQHPHHSPHHTPPSPSPSHASMRGTSDRSVREQVL